MFTKELKISGVTRNMLNTPYFVNAIQNGELNNIETQHIDGLNLDVPVSIEGIDSKVLTPKATWEDQDLYETYLKDLVQQFQNNFKKFSVRQEIVEAGPSI